MKRWTHSLRDRHNFVRLFKHEMELLIRMLTSTDHTHICRMLDSGVDQDHHAFIVSEYMRGQSLRDHLKSLGHGRLDPLATIEIVTAICEALAEGHKLGIMHREMSPHHIFVLDQEVNQRSLNVKLLNLGGSNLKDTLGDDVETHGFIGRLEYISPELFVDTGGVAHRTDFYSLGLVLYECLMGERPFTGSTPYLLLTQHKESPVPPLKLDISLEVKAELDALITWMTAKVPEHRPKSAYDIIEHLNKINELLKEINKAQRPLIRGLLGRVICLDVNG